MAANIPIATLTTMRDNYVTALNAISTSATSSYTIGDRTFTYEDRTSLQRDIRDLTTEILLRTTGNSANARGRNRMDFSSWD
jgi:predicted transcriptional regulator